MATNWPDKIPAWVIAVFGAVYLAAFSPCVFYVVGIHNDYEMLWFKDWSLFHSESAAMIAVGRPISALLTNITVLPPESIADFRWTRLFSIATVWVTGVQLLIICVCHLAIRPGDALAIALAVFLVPSFLYSVLAAAAWAPHLVTIFFAFWSYARLSHSNIQATAFYDLASRRDFRGLIPQFVAYARLKHVVVACIILQIALYNYPPLAMILTCLPIVILLFSRHTPAYRVILALRDVAFLVVNLLIYGITAKFLYIPVVRRLVFRFSDAWMQSDLSSFDVRMAESYRYSLNFDVVEMLRRFRTTLKVSGDLWFLPQFNVHVYFAALVAAVAVVALAYSMWRSRSESAPGWEKWYLYGPLMLATVFACFILAASAVLASSGGFVSYRTVAMPIAIASIIALFAARYAARFLGMLAGAGPRRTAVIGDFASASVVAAAAAAIFYDNYLTMRLSRNEHAYYSQMLQQAWASGIKNIVLVDPRPFSLPEDHPANFDQNGRAIPPYEVGCFSGYCLQTDAIFRIIARERGIDPRSLTIWPLRANVQGPGITCELLHSKPVSYPPGASDVTKQTIDHVRRKGESACFTYDLSWHDVSIDLSTNPRPVKMVSLKE